MSRIGGFILKAGVASKVPIVSRKGTWSWGRGWRNFCDALGREAQCRRFWGLG